MLRSLLLFVLVLGLVVVGGWMGCVRHNRVAPQGEELLYDDFGFSVKGVQQSKTFGPPGRDLAAKGTFWIVDLQVANHAKRVGYKLDAHQVVIVDERGRMFTESGSPSRATELPHGESCITRHVFDVPDDATILGSRSASATWGCARLRAPLGTGASHALRLVRSEISVERSASCRPRIGGFRFFAQSGLLEHPPRRGLHAGHDDEGLAGLQLLDRVSSATRPVTSSRDVVITRSRRALCARARVVEMAFSRPKSGPAIVDDDVLQVRIPRCGW
jgi:hypothetical protein